MDRQKLQAWADFAEDCHLSKFICRGLEQQGRKSQNYDLQEEKISSLKPIGKLVVPRTWEGNREPEVDPAQSKSAKLKILDLWDLGAARR